MQNLGLVAVGGALGAMSRYAVGEGFVRLGWTALPFATLAVNVLGGLAIGAAAVTLAAYPAPWRALLITGVLGGFTTFSAFSLETVNLIAAGRWAAAMLYVVASVVLSLLACWGAMALLRA